MTEQASWAVAPMVAVGGAASLEVTGEVCGVQVRAADGPPDASLLQARFAGRRPRLAVEGGRVRVEFSRLGWLARRQAGQLGLSPRVAWRLGLAGNVEQSTLDLLGLELLALEVGGDVSDALVRLPVPRGTVRVRTRRAVRGLMVERPVGVPVRVRLWAGASRVQFDGDQWDGVGEPLCWETPGYALALARYELEVHGVACGVRVCELRAG